MNEHQLRRREVLRSFLGVSAAATACRRAAAPASQIPVRFVDAIHETGHRLRHPSPALSGGEIRQVDCLIVGGGVAGLSAAWRLASAGVQDVLVVEVDDVEGGTAKSGGNAISRFPWGAHYLPAPLSMRGPVPRLLREFGVLVGTQDTGAPQFAEEALVHEPEERLYYRGSWYEGLYLRAGASADDLDQLGRFEAQMKRFAVERDGRGRKAFDVPLELGSDDAEWTSLDAMSMADWLDAQGLTSSRLRWLVDYACRDDFGATARDVSAWAGIWYFAARQPEEGRSQGYLSWPEGNGALVAHLAASLRPAQRWCSVLVHTLAPIPDSTDWEASALDIKRGMPLTVRARHVILATPRFVAGKVVQPWRAQPPAFLRAFQTGPWTVANLTLSRRPRSRGFPLAWDNVLYESRSLGYVVATHQQLAARVDGPTVLTWYYPHDGSDVAAERRKLLETTPEVWREVILSDLEPAHWQLARDIEAIEVMRWGHAMIRPVPGFVWGAHRRQAQQPVGRTLHFAHAELGGLALFEEANWHGVRAAEAVLVGLGFSQPTWL